MSDPQYDTPSGNPPIISGELALETVARRCREISDGIFARVEVYRRLSTAERDAGLAREAEHLRDLELFAGEARQLFGALVGFRTNEIERTVSRELRRKELNMTKLRIACMSVGAACLAASGVAKFAAGYPTLAVVFLVLGTSLTALATNLPAPKVTP